MSNLLNDRSISEQDEIHNRGAQTACVTLITMLIATPITHWLVNGEAAHVGTFLAAFIIGIAVSIPTGLTVIHQLFRGRPVAVEAVMALALSYTVAMLMASAIIGKSVFAMSDFFYAGVPAVAVFIWLKCVENKNVASS